MSDAKLKQLAVKINSLAKKEYDARLEFCRTLLEARRMFPDAPKFFAWADKNLKKPNGDPWARQTLLHCLRYGKDPSYLYKDRAQKRQYGRIVQRAFHSARKPNSVSDEVNALVEAWDAASNPARAQFLQIINARLVQNGK